MPKFQTFNQALIWHRPFKVRNCWFPFNKRRVWCGSCWKIIKWYLIGMKVLNDTKLILNDLGGHLCSFRNNLVLFRFQIFQMLSISQTSFLIGTFFCRFLQQDGSRILLQVIPLKTTKVFGCLWGLYLLPNSCRLLQNSKKLS